MLLAPLLAHIGSKRRWIVLPDGALATAPIDAWLRPDPKGNRRVLEEHELHYVHSWTVRASLARVAGARAAGRGLVALGDPRYGGTERVAEAAAPSAVAVVRGTAAFTPLPGSRKEVEAIAALYPPKETTTLLGADASLAKLLAATRARATPIAVVHLACHGLLDDALPRLSGLVLAGGDVLTVERLYASRVDADLAICSACRTGRGRASRGEGILGLTRGFFRAGVPRVVVSSWLVEDRSTAELMKRLHVALGTPGTTAAAALRQARRSMMGTEAYAHPYYWAGFQLWGLGD
jgi:CHAT domain-containing protein